MQASCVELWASVARSLVAFATGVLICLGITGCSDRVAVYPVRGQVVMADGSPVDFGLLEFRDSSSKLNARARIQKDGSYQLTTFEAADGAVAGSHQVIVVQHVVAEVAPPQEQSGEQEHPTTQHREHRIVDPQFRSYETSPLVFEVKAVSDNVIDIKVF